MPMPRKVLSSQEVADLLKCSVRTVLRLKRDRRIPEPLAIGRPYRWNRATVVQWIDDGCPVPEPAADDSESSTV